MLRSLRQGLLILGLLASLGQAQPFIYIDSDLTMLPKTKSATSAMFVPNSEFPNFLRFETFTHDSTPLSANLGLGFGWQLPAPVMNFSSSAISVSIERFFPVEIAGQRTEWSIQAGGTPEKANAPSNYSYDLSQILTMAHYTVNFRPLWHNLFPFLTLSLGVDNIKTDHPRETLNKDGKVVNYQTMRRHIQNNLAYGTNLGLRWQHDHTALSIFYRYIDAGTATTAMVNGITSNSSIPMTQFSTPLSMNSFMARFSYQF